MCVCGCVLKFRSDEILMFVSPTGLKVDGAMVVGGVYGLGGALAPTCASNAAVSAVPTGQIYWSQYWRTKNRTPQHKVCAQRAAIGYGTHGAICRYVVTTNERYKISHDIN